MNNRIIFSDDEDLIDYSTALNNYKAGTKSFSYVTGEDFFYIGARLPFNHFYAKFQRASELTDSEMTLEYWNGTEWCDIVELIDETNGFSENGYVTWVTSKDKEWSCEDTNYNGNQVEGLEDVVIYDRYWIRISFDQSFDGGDDGVIPTPARVPCIISWLGNIFSNDNDLAGEHKALTKQSLMTAFEAGKTSWEEQHEIAARELISDLVENGNILEKGQILSREDYRLASVSKTAEIIYGQLGDDYKDEVVTARKVYKERLSKRRPIIDTNLNGREDNGEGFQEQRFFKR